MFAVLPASSAPLHLRLFVKLILGQFQRASVLSFFDFGIDLSFPRRRESRRETQTSTPWIPAYAGMTKNGTLFSGKSLALGSLAPQNILFVVKSLVSVLPIQTLAAL